MKSIGKLISALGTIAAILYPPYKVLGDTHWGFIAGNIVEMFGRGVPVYEHIDYAMLLIEIIAVNAVGIALMLMGKGK